MPTGSFRGNNRWKSGRGFVNTGSPRTPFLKGNPPGRGRGLGPRGFGGPGFRGRGTPRGPPRGGRSRF